LNISLLLVVEVGEAQILEEGEALVAIDAQELVNPLAVVPPQRQ
jgi:hypothetical protein